MSELQALCSTLSAIDQDIMGTAQQLQQHAQRCARAAQYAASTVRNEDGTTNPGATHAANALNVAARAASQAAQLLAQAAHQGQAFVARTVAGSTNGAGSSAPASVSGDGAVETPGLAQSLEQIQGWISEVNPGYDGDPYSPRSVNCGSCAAAIFARLSGDMGATAGIRTLSIAEMESATGRTQTKMTPDQIRDHLVEQGPGSHVVVGVDRQFGAGHWFNAYFDGKQVVAIDGQTGTIHDWPPEYGSVGNPVVYWDAGV